MKLFITGATGFIGQNLVAQALKSNHSVRAMVRSGKGDELPQGTEIIHGSLPFDIPASSLVDVDAIIHCAAVTTSDKAAESFTTNLDGTKYLLDLARLSGIKKFVFLSTQSAHEDSATPYGQSKLAAESVVKNSGLAYVIFRPGLVYGPGKIGLFARMVETVRKLPILPLLGGGKTLVQPIEVSVLCAMILKSLELTTNAELNVGSEIPITLAEFLNEISFAYDNKKKLAVSIPIKPLEIVAGIGERLKLKLPVSTDNLRGLKTVRKMDSKPAFDLLGIYPIPLREGLSKAVKSSPIVHGSSKKQIALIGAGKVGILHAVNLRESEQATLCAIVDSKPNAAALYHSLGFRAKQYQTIEEIADKCDAAIIATPAFTHLSVAETCLEKNLSILVEKPLCVSLTDIEKWNILLSKYPQSTLHVGYMMTQMPHLLDVQEWLKDGRIGTITGGTAIAMQSHIMGAKPVRWEMKKKLAGGGAVINFGCHVLSVLFRIFGVPETESPFAWSVFSEEVEDVAGAKLNFGNFKINYFASWSAPNYPKPDNRIILRGEKGTIVFDNAKAVLSSNETIVEMKTQLDYNVGFNIAPDYTGGGFANEHRNLLSSLGISKSYGSEIPNPVLLNEALELEKWIHNFYGMIDLQKPTSTPLWIESCEMLKECWDNLEANGVGR